jgi:hypothetical protein
MARRAGQRSRSRSPTKTTTPRRRILITDLTNAINATASDPRQLIPPQDDRHVWPRPHRAHSPPHSPVDVTSTKITSRWPQDGPSPHAQRSFVSVSHPTLCCSPPPHPLPSLPATDLTRSARRATLALLTADYVPRLFPPLALFNKLSCAHYVARSIRLSIGHTSSALFRNPLGPLRGCSWLHVSGKLFLSSSEHPPLLRPKT